MLKIRNALNISIKTTKHTSVPKVSPIRNASIVGRLLSGKISPAKIMLCPREFIMEDVKAMTNKFLQVDVETEFAF